jgi:outer membrane protein TolC
LADKGFFFVVSKRQGSQVIMQRLPALFLLASLVVAGCSLYSADPLPDQPSLKPAMTAPQRPLNMTEIAVIAVAQNPDLLASRRKLSVAHAQAFVAGLLPNPQLSGEIDFPTQAHVAGLVNGYTYSLAEDLQGLLLTPSRRAAAEATEDQARLSELWDEWQTIEKAGSLYAKKVFADQKAAILDEQERILAAQAEHSSRALAGGDTTIDLAGADAAAALDVASQLNAAKRDALGADTDLKTFLGITPQASLSLLPLDDPQPLAKADVETALRNIAKARPDLLALQAGYKAQEEAVYQAVLSQFPAITLGGNRAADTTNIHSTGLTASVSLPLFDFGQGAIKVQRATREQLKAEYTARLDQTTADAWHTWQQCQLLSEEIDTLDKRLPEFRKMAEQGQRAYRAGNLSAATYVLMQTSRIARESELIDLRAALWSNTLALRTLLGLTYAPATAEKSS